MRRGILTVGLLLGVLWGSASAQITVTLEALPDRRHVATARPLTNATALTDGQWMSVKGVQPLSIHITGITDATVEIDGSNAPTMPANTTHGIKLNSSNITTNQLIELDLSLAWLKVRVTSYTSGTINADLIGYTR